MLTNGFGLVFGTLVFGNYHNPFLCLTNILIYFSFTLLLYFTDNYIRRAHRT